MRRTNPRDALGWEGRLTARHRILRRGMPYGPALPEGAPDDGAARGLLFVCLQASISRQFEIVQTQWCNDGNAFGLGREADPISGPSGREVRHIIEGEPPRVAAPLRSYVDCRGGEYLVVPSISALRSLPGLYARRHKTARRARNARRNGALEHRSTPSHAPGSDQPWSQAMTSREHARRLMLILLTSEGTALRKAADDRMLRREQTRPTAGVAKAPGDRKHRGPRGDARARDRGVAVVGRPPADGGRAPRAVGLISLHRAGGAAPGPGER